MLSERSDPANPSNQTFELNLFKKCWAYAQLVYKLFDIKNHINCEHSPLRHGSLLSHLQGLQYSLRLPLLQINMPSINPGKMNSMNCPQPSTSYTGWVSTPLVTVSSSFSRSLRKHITRYTTESVTSTLLNIINLQQAITKASISKTSPATCKQNKPLNDYNAPLL